MSATTLNQALSALLLLCLEQLQRDLELAGVIRARQKRRLPAVLTLKEVRAVLERMNGVEALVAELLDGSGLRLMEAQWMRVKDLDFEGRELTVRDGKVSKDRRALYPSTQYEALRHHLQAVRVMH